MNFVGVVIAGRPTLRPQYGHYEDREGHHDGESHE